MTKRWTTTGLIQSSAPLPIQDVAASGALADVVMVLLIVSMIYSIVNVPLLPVAPSVALPFVLLWLCHREFTVWWSRLWQISELRWLLALFGWLIAAEFIGKGVSYAALSEVGRLAAAVISVVALAAYGVGQPKRLQRLVAVALVALAISVIWFLLEISVEQPFVEWRMGLYADVYQNASSDAVDNIRSGLAPYSQLIGYQLAAFVPMLFMLLLLGKRRLLKLLAIIGMSVAFVTMYFTSQRSSLVAIGLSFLVILLLSSQRRRWMAALPGLLVIGVIAALLITQGDWITQYLQVPLIEKLRSLQSADDASLRLALQVRALELIVTNPFGLPVAGLNWETAGAYPVYQASQAPITMQAIPVHNGYLGQSLNYGLLFLLPTVLMLAAIFRTSWRLVRSEPPAADYPRAIWIGVPAAVLGLFFPQSMTHNASILSREPVCIIFLALLLALEVTRRYYVEHSAAKSTSTLDRRLSTRAELVYPRSNALR